MWRDPSASSTECQLTAPERRHPTVIAETVRHDPRRLAAVRETGLLDAPIDETLDAFGRLASALLNAPVAFLSIVDAECDVHVAQRGMPEPQATTRRVPGRTFCHYVVVSDEPLVIEDTQADPVWRAVPSVKAFGVRSFLGAPVSVEDHVIGSLCVVDFTPRRWSETEIETLVQLSRSASREIALRSAIRAATAEAARARALALANEELLAVVAHDLRSPLQAISLTTALLRHDADATQAPHLTRVAGATAAMTRMVDELLATHSTGLRTAAHRAPISVQRLLDDAADAMEPVVNRAGLLLTRADDAVGRVVVDHALMLRALCNLIGNCVKYCPAGCTVRLTAQIVSNSVEISIVDDGPGIRPEDQQRVFESGWQGRDALRRNDGAGLGLSIVRTLVERNGGTVALNSVVSRGTTVSIRLPAD